MTVDVSVLPATVDSGGCCGLVISGDDGGSWMLLSVFVVVLIKVMMA